MEILYCTTVLPSGQRTGGEIASQAFIDSLRNAGHTVTVLGYQRPKTKPTNHHGEISVGIRPIETESARVHSIAWLLRSLLKRRPYSAQKYVSAQYVAAVSALLKRQPDCLVVVDHAQIGFLLTHIPSHHDIIFVAHNVEQELYRDQLHNTQNVLLKRILQREANLIGILEGHLATRATQCWVLTEHDSRAFRQMNNNTPVVRFDLPGITPASNDDVATLVDYDIGLIGTWTWEANAIGLRWFIDQVCPLLPTSIRICIAGKGGEQYDHKNIRALGFVDSAMAFMTRCRVVCIPSMAGGGIQIKTLDAIASGRPVVATSVAIRGIDAPPPTLSIADDAHSFATHILSALKGQSEESTQHAIAWAKQRRSKFAKQLETSIAQIRR